MSSLPLMSRDLARQVLRIEAQAILGLLDKVDEHFDKAVALLHHCQGRVVTTGMGKSGIICRKLAATLASTGTPALFLHPAEALHGDLGMMTAGDVVLAVSQSGETDEVVRLLATLKRLGVPLIALTGNATSTLAANADAHIHIAIDKEACPMNLAPTASTTATLAMGDALAMAVALERGFREEDFALLHPGGKLGKRLMKVRQLMHTGERIPRVGPETPMKDVIYEMSRKGMGITSVVDGEGRLLGVISDGDLRRLLEHDSELLGKRAETCLRQNPITISAEELASAALHLMEEKRITALFVPDTGGKLEGVLHLHDLWGIGLF